MNVTVLGVFVDRAQAAVAVANLKASGFRPEQVRIVDANTSDRHQFIHKKTSDTRRGIVLGAIFGAVLGAAAGAALTSVFGLWQAALAGGITSAVGGTILGLIVGRTTEGQIRDELEHQVDAGFVLVSVDTDSEHGPRAMELLTSLGGTGMVITPASYTAGVLPANPQPAARQQVTD